MALQRKGRQALARQHLTPVRRPERQSSRVRQTARLRNARNDCPDLQVSPAQPFPMDEFPKFLHCASRYCTRGKENACSKSAKLALQVRDTIVTVLQQYGKIKLEDMKPWFRKALRANTDKDRSFEIALLIAGIRSYTRAGKDAIERKIEVCGLFIDAAAGALSAVPTCGALFSAAGSLAKYIQKKAAKKKQRQLDTLIAEMDNWIYENVTWPVTCDGELKFWNGVDEGSEEITPVDPDVFNKWYHRLQPPC